MFGSFFYQCVFTLTPCVYLLTSPSRFYQPPFDRCQAPHPRMQWNGSAEAQASFFLLSKTKIPEGISVLTATRTFLSTPDLPLLPSPVCLFEKKRIPLSLFRFFSNSHRRSNLAPPHNPPGCVIVESEATHHRRPMLPNMSSPQDPAGTFQDKKTSSHRSLSGWAGVGVAEPQAPELPPSGVRSCAWQHPSKRKGMLSFTVCCSDPFHITTYQVEGSRGREEITPASQPISTEDIWNWDPGPSASAARTPHNQRPATTPTTTDTRSRTAIWAVWLRGKRTVNSATGTTGTGTSAEVVICECRHTFNTSPVGRPDSTWYVLIRLCLQGSLTCGIHRVVTIAPHCTDTPP